MQTKFYYIYILSNYKRTAIYIGITNNLIRRVYEHKNNLQDSHTKKYNINRLIYYEIYEDVMHALEREKQLKKWTREKKNTLIWRLNPLWKDLYFDLI